MVCVLCVCCCVPQAVVAAVDFLRRVHPPHRIIPSIFTRCRRKKQVFEANSRNVLRQLRGHARAVHAAQFAPDGTHILSCGDDVAVRWWDLTAGKQVRMSGWRRLCGFGGAGVAWLRGCIVLRVWRRSEWLVAHSCPSLPRHHPPSQPNPTQPPSNPPTHPRRNRSAALPATRIT